MQRRTHYSLVNQTRAALINWRLGRGAYNKSISATQKKYSLIKCIVAKVMIIICSMTDILTVAHQSRPEL